jgi:transcriptional regulator with GAF, ATPase, and Fis domain
VRRTLVGPASVASGDPDAAAPVEGEGLRARLVLALEAHHGNVAEVARVLGRTRMQIHRWMRRFAIDPARYRG